MLTENEPQYFHPVISYFQNCDVVFIEYFIVDNHILKSKNSQWKKISNQIFVKKHFPTLNGIIVIRILYAIQFSTYFTKLDISKMNKPNTETYLLVKIHKYDREDLIGCRGWAMLPRVRQSQSQQNSRKNPREETLKNSYVEH